LPILHSFDLFRLVSGKLVNCFGPSSQYSNCVRYIIGVAVRLAVDLGLHYEDGSDIDTAVPDPAVKAEKPAGESREGGETLNRERGRRFWIRDMRRRLWWCTYSFDRLVSTCVGRPFGISDQVITTEFPSLLDDKYITPTGFLEPSVDILEPSYKTVAYHYFRLRLLQSEILQVLQYNQAQIERANGQNIGNKDMHTNLPSPFLVKFDSFRSWRIDIDRRLYEWRTSAPARQETGVQFATEFLELNYWQALIVLYRQSLSVPPVFEGEYNTSNEVNSPTVYASELREDEDRVYLKVAEAGQKILRIYRQLHVSGLVSYTYLTTHHLFVAGISYLYAIWHSPIVRSRLVGCWFRRGRFKLTLSTDDGRSGFYHSCGKVSIFRSYR
jgi:Fungal specific transcription factor domain